MATRPQRTLFDSFRRALEDSDGFWPLLKKTYRVFRMGGWTALKNAVSNGNYLNTVARKDANAELMSTDGSADPIAPAVHEEQKVENDNLFFPEARGDSAEAPIQLKELFPHLSGQTDDYVPYMEHPALHTLTRIIAFYLPQFHPIPENDEWWGKGFTEWTNVSRALPRFQGHYQPRLPGELGYYDLRLVEVQQRQVELAKNYGIHGFCFHYYWFGGRRLLELPVRQFVDHPDIDFPFCFCWANENWTRRWDGYDDDIIMKQTHSPEDDMAFIRDIEASLRNENYIRVDGRPLLIIYRADKLPDARATAERWRNHCSKSGIGDLYLVATQCFGVEDPREYGFDAAVEFPPHKLALEAPAINHRLNIIDRDFRGHVIDYSYLVEEAKKQEKTPYTLFRGVFPSWDNEPRMPGRGYAVAGSSPELYHEWLSNAIRYAQSNNSENERLVFINSWNEWAEGAYLEPDRRYGYAFLETTFQTLRESVANDSALRTDERKIVYVSHDAHPNGSQLLSLNIVKTLTMRLGYNVHMLLGEGGVLESEFAQYATVHNLKTDVNSDQELNDLVRTLYRGGFEIAICNTSVVGKMVKVLKHEGFRVASLIHELPTLIKSYGLERSIGLIARHADKVVFAAEFVQRMFTELTGLDPLKSVIRPQGLYNKPRKGIDRNGSRQRLRKELGLPDNAQIVLNVGYGDLRKGLDLFVAVARLVITSTNDVYFIWAGNYDKEPELWTKHDIAAAGLSDRVILHPFSRDIEMLYAGADLFLITSREDPFPATVQEAMSHGLPTIGFADAGGFSELLQSGSGILVPYLDIHKMAVETINLLADDQRRVAIAHRAQHTAEKHFNWESYVYDLLQLLGHTYKKVSVIVPNYNYSRYIQKRITSIFEQNYPIYEVIFLDDCSSDDSVSVVNRLCEKRGYEIDVVVNRQNSGSAFKQWFKGVQLAKGDYIWIAEADDFADPDFLKEITKAFDDPSVVMSLCESRQIDSDGGLLAHDYRDYVKDIDQEKWKADYVRDGLAEVKDSLAIKNSIPNVSAVLFRREVLLRVLEEDLDRITSFKVAGDWFTYSRILLHGKISYCATSLNNHRRHDKSITISSKDLQHLREIVDVQSIIEETHGVEEHTRIIAKRYVRTVAEMFELGSEDQKTSPRVPGNVLKLFR